MGTPRQVLGSLPLPRLVGMLVRRWALSRIRRLVGLLFGPVTSQSRMAIPGVRDGGARQQSPWVMAWALVAASVRFRSGWWTRPRCATESARPRAGCALRSAVQRGNRRLHFCDLDGFLEPGAVGGLGCPVHESSQLIGRTGTLSGVARSCLLNPWTWCHGAQRPGGAPSRNSRPRDRT